MTMPDHQNSDNKARTELLGHSMVKQFGARLSTT